MLLYRAVRVLISYSKYDGITTVHCLGADAHTLISPFYRVASEQMLYELLRSVGGDANRAKIEIDKWGRGGLWANVPNNRLYLLGIKRPLI